MDRFVVRIIAFFRRRVQNRGFLEPCEANYVKKGEPIIQVPTSLAKLIASVTSSEPVVDPQWHWELS